MKFVNFSRSIFFGLYLFGALELMPVMAADAEAAAGLSPVRLRCEYRVDPVGVDFPQPRFDWVLQPVQTVARGLRQSAYQILASSSRQLLDRDEGDLWNSGKVAGDAMSQIVYAGKPLSSHQAVWWKVRVWDAAGAPSAWSAVSRWTMGIIRAEDWKGAKWIGAPDLGTKPDLNLPKAKYETVLLRREFSVKPNLKRALAMVCGLGQYEMTVNGGKVSEDLLTPGWSQYEKTCLYDTYDITRSLRAGENAVGILLGNGMYLVHGGRFAGNTKMTWAYRPIQAIALVRLEYDDGSVENVMTDETWRCLSGPITFSSIYGGEDYDARLEPKGWDQPGFAGQAWEKPAILDSPGGLLRGLSCAAPPIRAFGSLAPAQSKEIKPGTTVYDLGQNTSMMLKIKTRGSAGSMVRVIPGELLKADGTVDGQIFGYKPVWWQYTLKGEGEESYSSKFFYVGSRYLQVELIPAKGETGLPSLDLIEGNIIHADSPAVGTFSCSNQLFNRTFDLIRWAQQSNMVSILTDCPTREKRGWLEQTHLSGPSLRYNWDMDISFTKLSNDMKDSQRDDGLVPTTAPHYSHWNRPFADAPEWSSACILVPWQQYETSGDIEILKNSYEMMKRYQAFLTKESRDGIVPYGLGDWLNIGPGGYHDQSLTPVKLTSTAFYYKDTLQLSKIAEILGHLDEAEQFRIQAEQIRDAFNRAFFNSGKPKYGEGKSWGSQCSTSLPLVMGLAPADARQPLLTDLVEDVRKMGLTAGYVGHRYLLRALAESGRSDVIYRLVNQSDKPGYGYLVKLGKTSLTENWSGGESQNHFVLGGINEWFYHDLAGIQGDPTAPGFKKIIIKPQFPEGLSWVKASYDSISGKIASEWNRNGHDLDLHITIPVNTTATVYLPAVDAGSVREGGKPIAGSSGPVLLRTEGSHILYQVGSGTYHFQSVLPETPDD